MQSLVTIEGVKKTLFGIGAVKQLPHECETLAAKKTLLVMDRSLSETDFSAQILDLFKGSQVEAVPYFEVTPEPSPLLADRGSDLAKQIKADCVIGVGGGSTMDVAKAIGVLAKNSGKAEDYIGLGLIKSPGLPTIMVPTTAGTGSEVTFTSVFTMRDKKTKGGINSPFLYPHMAILDPELTAALPPQVTAYTGMDALTHAVESYTSLQAHFMSELISLEAVKMISSNLRGAVFSGSHMPYREQMMKASYMAGLGLAMAGVGAVHALAYPLGALFDVPHGVANALMLPYVLEYNFAGDSAKFARIAEAMGEKAQGRSERDAAYLAVKAIWDLVEDIGIPSNLGQLNIPEDAVREMAEGAMKVTRPIENNPRPMTAEIAEKIYKRAFEGRK